MMSHRRILLLLIACLWAVTSHATAATTGSFTVLWNANTTDADLAGYRVYLSADSGVFNLTPAQAAAVAITRVTGATTTQSLITGLDTATVYWIGVTSFDASGNESDFSNVVSAQPLQGGDVTSPYVSMTTPAAGSSLSGTVTVTANATDDTGVAGVQFQIDGSNIGAEDTATPFSISWNTTTVSNGAHSLTAVARDAAGNTDTSTRAITISNTDLIPPTAAVTAPGAGATVVGTINVTASASDNVGVAGVQFQVDGVNQGAEDTVSPYSISWSTAAVVNGPHTLTSRSRDIAGNRTTSIGVVVTVNNSDTTPPTVSMSAPASGATVLATVTVSANASDNNSVAGVQFKVDGSNLGAEDTVAPYSISWNTLAQTNGSHTLTAVARDGAGNTTTSSSRSVTVNNPDTTPPTVSMTAPVAGATLIGTTLVTANAADNMGVSGVQFQLDSVNLGAEDTLAPFSLSWSTTATINGSHTLKAIARDAAGNRTTSASVTLTVNNPDITPPTVSMSAPASGATVLATVTVSATASDNNGVAGVQFKLDGSNVGAEDMVAPYSISWNTTGVSNGSHVLTAVARDGAGNTTTSLSRVVTVNNPDTTPPTVSMTAPIGGATLLGTALVTASAADNIGVAGVQFQIDGVNLSAEDTVAPYSLSWNTTATINGSHTLRAVARDAAGNRTTSAGVILTVNNPDTTPPTASISAPASGATVLATVTVSATASDNNGVAGVQFKVDGSDLGAEDTVAPYSISWNTTSLANGSHKLTAVARDGSGNTTVSPERNVTVNNPDRTPPTVSMTAPAAGATLIGTAILTATAADNMGVAGVQFQIDGVNLGAEDTLTPYSFSWNTTAMINGSHTLTAIARDTSGNRTTSTGRIVTVNNPDITPPTVSMTAPSGGSNVIGVVIVSANANDNMGVTGVQFQLDGADLETEDTVAPFAITWPSTSAANGPHTLTAVARDAAGNTTRSAGTSVTVNNSDLTPPTTSILSPAQSATLSGTIPITATASDNVGVIALIFEMDGIDMGSVLIAPPYSLSWDTTAVANGSHTLAAVARDAAGNTTRSAEVVVDVSNTTPGTCGAGLDTDGDGVCSPSDNCSTMYNPTQMNTDGDREGGDSCDITVTAPLNGDLTCADAPPTITWTPETYTMFKVFVGTTVSYSKQVSSGKKYLTTASWTMSAAKWATVCKNARPFLFIKVIGRNPNSKWFEFSETATIVAK